MRLTMLSDVNIFVIVNPRSDVRGLYHQLAETCIAMFGPKVSATSYIERVIRFEDKSRIKILEDDARPLRERIELRGYRNVEYIYLDN